MILEFLMHCLIYAVLQNDSLSISETGFDSGLRSRKHIFE
jgi:hypothetical protein